MYKKYDKMINKCYYTGIFKYVLCTRMQIADLYECVFELTIYMTIFYLIKHILRHQVIKFYISTNKNKKLK